MQKSDFELLEKEGQTGYLYSFGGKGIRVIKCVYYTNRQLGALRAGNPMPYTLITAKDKHHCWIDREPETLFYRSDDPDGTKYFSRPEDDDVWYSTLTKEDDPINGWKNEASLRGYLYLDKIFFKRSLPLYFSFMRADEKACEMFMKWAENEKTYAMNKVKMYDDIMDIIKVENVTNE